ncbi:ATP-dependent helicase HrpB [Corynebacterium sp. ES2775-CONJ]|uniref:ATP-dependent helicase HrpB n=1 Tax=Corynebacterium sp. ES2775-CONJ TaxID=2974029 RepID=UPI002168A373|nr:ATP-dependent helicase HrpB [Corynebacterium sp. ES2775-CONJ]MCS4490397.1 ATP-dependent helicase HrpB [Corynebacterium sp. ES2775-CONJ]
MVFALESIGRGLSVSAIASEITTALDDHRTVVVQAPPGTGKTTFIPPLVANTCALNGKVLVTAPRRVAVRQAARRLAQLDHSSLGDRVGYTVRGESHPGALVEFLTPGVLVRRLIADPELSGVSAVLIDEVHERQLDTDLLMGMLVELRQLRPELIVGALSATVDTARCADLLSAPVIRTDSVLFPLDISYVPLAGRAECHRDFLHQAARLAVEKATSSPHSVLVFMPGVREVNTVCRDIEALSSVKVFALYGQLSRQAQDEALYSPGQRIVVATPVAESSLTVPGVRIVIDSGLVRTPKRDAGRSLSGLVTTSCSQSSAIQRAGRAGREGPGEVIRLYGQHDFAKFQPHIQPEILAADLSNFLLLLLGWGGRLSDFPLLDPPPMAAVESALATLDTLAALDDKGQLNAWGRKLAEIPAPPRYAHALLKAGKQAAKVIAAMMEDARGDLNQVIRDLSPTPRFRREVSRLQRYAPDDARSYSVGEIVALAMPESIAHNEGEVYLLASGTRATLRNLWADHKPEWIAIADMTLQARGAQISLAAPLDHAAALRIYPPTEECSTCISAEGKIRAIKRKKLGAITLSERPVAPDRLMARRAYAEAISSHGIDFFELSDRARHLLDRLHFLYERLGEPWPDIAALDPLTWLGPELDALAEGAGRKDIDLYPALRRILPWPIAGELDQLAPESLQVPSGRLIRVDYRQRPTVAVKLQECFGLDDTPTILGQPVLFELLSPAGRVLARTDDFSRFWSGAYVHIRSEMRGRYPKHPWPEHPSRSDATAKTKRALGR